MQGRDKYLFHTLLIFVLCLCHYNLLNVNLWINYGHRKQKVTNLTCNW